MASTGRRRALKAALAVPVAALAAACQVRVPGQGPPPDLYRLTPKSTYREDLPTVSWQLVLEKPLANAGIDTTRIALQRTPMQIEYYAKSGWSDRAPLMIQTLMIESFENSGRIVAVGRDVVGLRADFVLKSELREFQAEYFGGKLPRVRVGISVRLVQMPRRAIIGSKSFEHVVTAEADTIDAIIAAFDESLGKVLRRLVEWTVLTGEAARRTS
ncbi:MAG: ABC-type transport auxiliary lipoprotein family protein [Kiloniellaceae bacterium]